MITRITGKLVQLAENEATLAAGPFDYQVYVPEFVRRQLQPKLDGEVSLQTPAGRLIPLKNIASFAPQDSPLSIDRLDRQRVVVVSGAVEGRDLGSVITELQERLQQLNPPAGFTVELGGDYEQQQESFRMLLGRRSIRKHFVVDPGRSYVGDRPSREENGS